MNTEKTPTAGILGVLYGLAAQAIWIPAVRFVENAWPQMSRPTGRSMTAQADSVPGVIFGMAGDALTGLFSAIPEIAQVFVVVVLFAAWCAFAAWVTARFVTRITHGGFPDQRKHEVVVQYLKKARQIAAILCLATFFIGVWHVAATIVTLPTLPWGPSLTFLGCAIAVTYIFDIVAFLIMEAESRRKVGNH